MRSLVILSVVAMSLAVGSPRADATLVTFGFECITNNNVLGAAIGESQFFVDVVSGDPCHVSFVFRNTGPEASTMSELYFESGPVSGISDIVNMTGVEFSVGGTPHNLPGGNTLADPFAAAFVASADNPAPKLGVNPYEQVEVIFALNDGMTYEGLLSDIFTGDMRIGIHALSMGNTGSSESFVNKTDPNPPSVPEPATLAVLAAGFFGIRRSRRTV
jgi:hypothetical protein